MTPWKAGHQWRRNLMRLGMWDSPPPRGGFMKITPECLRSSPSGSTFRGRPRRFNHGCRCRRGPPASLFPVDPVESSITQFLGRSSTTHSAEPSRVGLLDFTLIGHGNAMGHPPGADGGLQGMHDPPPIELGLGIRLFDEVGRAAGTMAIIRQQRRMDTDSGSTHTPRPSQRRKTAKKVMGGTC